MGAPGAAVTRPPLTGQTRTMATDWYPDVLGQGFEATTLTLAPDEEGEVVATLVRAPAPASTAKGAVLYLHGFNDYFFQVDLARWYTERGWAFYALDLRKHGRSLRPHQTPNLCASLTDYDEELDASAALLADAGHQRVLLTGHSTGGLTLPLWAARRRELPLAGLMLNSPFLEFKQPQAVRAAMVPLARGMSRRNPTRAVPAGVSGLYGESLHVSAHGEWDYDLAWKPIESFAVRFGWLHAIATGHHLVHHGLDLTVPVLAMSSTRTITAKAWTPELKTGDAVLDATSIARWSVALGRNVTCVRIEGGMHDLVLSPPPARATTYEAMDTWLDAWVA
jgi:alpha-beta hydrolase superfamily lysophospholipase